MFAYQRDAVASRERRSSVSWTQTPSPRSINSSCRETAPMSANGCQNAVVLVTAMPGTVSVRGPRGCPTPRRSGVQRGAQGRAHVAYGRTGVGGGLPAPEAVDGALAAVEGDPDAGPLERGGVRLALVAQDVALRGEHVGRREAAQVGRAQRRRVGLPAVRPVEVDL